MTTEMQPRRRPDLPTHEFTVVEAFDIHKGLRRVVFDAPAFDYKPGQDVVFILTLEDGTTGRRHYTIRARDAQGRILIDFVMHGAGVGAALARDAAAGQKFTVRGPRGRSWLHEDTPLHLILADETGLPAALHMAETRKPDQELHLVIEIQDESWQQEVPQGVKIDWVLRGDQPAGPNSLLRDHVSAMELPASGCRAIIMAETSNTRALRHHLIDRGFTKETIASEGYWRPGRLGGHDHVED